MRGPRSDLRRVAGLARPQKSRSGRAPHAPGRSARGSRESYCKFEKKPGERPPGALERAHHVLAAPPDEAAEALARDPIDPVEATERFLEDAAADTDEPAIAETADATQIHDADGEQRATRAAHAVKLRIACAAPKARPASPVNVVDSPDSVPDPRGTPAVQRPRPRRVSTPLFVPRKKTPPPAAFQNRSGAIARITSLAGLDALASWRCAPERRGVVD